MEARPLRRLASLKRHLVTTASLVSPSNLSGSQEHYEYLENVYCRDENFTCFGCSIHNKTGLQLRPYYDREKDEVCAKFTATDDQTSYPGVVHGGIISVLIDDIAYWTLHKKVCFQAINAVIDLEFVVAKDCTHDEDGAVLFEGSTPE